MYQFKAKLLALLMLAACAVPEEPPKEEVVRSEQPALAEWQWADGELPWGTWDESLFALAQREDKPILVYLAAPGCEGLFPAPTPALRQLVADKFVSVQVDPFKRPDIARHYDSGGWPALVVALPDGRVFARAVDIPPVNVESYLRRLHTAYEEKREILVAKVQRAARPKVEKPVAIDAVYRACAAAFDAAHGGFGGPTKFLETSVLRFLLVYAETRGTASARQMALASLDAVLASPLGDGGSFRPYSYAPDWSAPAGERDALDQAAMLHLLLEAGQPRYSESARALLGFVEGDALRRRRGRVSRPPSHGRSFDKLRNHSFGKLRNHLVDRPHALRRPPSGPDPSLSRCGHCARRRTRCSGGLASRRRAY